MRGAAYLHNAADRGVRTSSDLVQERTRPLFTEAAAGRVARLPAPAPRGRAGRARGRPADEQRRTAEPEVLALAAEEMKEREHFTLLADSSWRTGWCLHAVKQARAADRKGAVMVTRRTGQRQERDRAVLDG